MTSDAISTEHVLVVPVEAVARFFDRPAFHAEPTTSAFVRDAIRRHGYFVDRSWAETNESVKQIVAYGLIRNGDRLLRLRRAAKGKRHALRLRYTILVGGHVDDQESASEHPLEDCLRREIFEELHLRPHQEPQLLGVVADPTTAVGRLHLGIIFDVPMELDAVVIRSNYDNSDFANAKRRVEYKLVTAKSLGHIAARFDPWSSLLLASETARALFGDLPAFSSGQAKLPLVWSEYPMPDSLANDRA
jgi:predicted NUDIX family phosphoesterase